MNAGNSNIVHASSASVLMAYVPEWRNLNSAQIPAEKLTHVLYAFSLVSANGECTTMGAPATAARNLTTLREVKARNPQLHILISVGGWTGSAHFSASVLTEAGRQTLVKSCIDLWIKGQGPIGISDVIDGIDIDWEFPGSPGETRNFSPDDKENFALLMEEFRRQLDDLGATVGTRYLLTAAFNVTPPVVAAGYDITRLARTLDYVNLMTYDLHGVGAPAGPTNFHNSLYRVAGDPSPDMVRETYNASSAVQRFIEDGAAPRQIVVGIPYYGRGWENVVATGGASDGLFQPANGALELPYRQIRAHYEPSYPKHRHPEARVPYLFDPATRVFLAYDDPESVREKVEYALRNGLAGLIVWELSMDDAQFTLTNAIWSALNIF